MPTAIRLPWSPFGLAALFALTLLTPTLFAQAADPCSWPGFNCQAPCSNNPPNQNNGVWPITGNAQADKITAPFGPRLNGGSWDYHEGIDIATRVGTTAATGLDVHAPWAGWVVSTVNDGRCGAGVLLKHTANATDPIGPSTIVTAYCHLTSTAGSLWSGLEAGDYVAQGAFFVDSGNTGNVDPHLHLSTRLGCNEERCAVNPVRLYSLHHPHSGHPEVYFERFYDENGQKKLTFSVFNRAQPSDGPGCPGGCDENLHFNRLTIKSPWAALKESYGLPPTGIETVTIDLDRRINDDSPVINGGGPGVAGNGNGTVVTETSMKRATTLTIAPRRSTTATTTTRSSRST